MKTYKEYKNTPSIKTPFIAWVFDRPIIYISLLAVFVLGLGAVSIETVEKMRSIQNPVIETPWLEVEPEDPPSIIWLKTYSKPPVDGVWEQGEITIQNPPGCPEIGSVVPPATMIGSISSNKERQSIVTQVYQPGEALPQWEKYKEKAKKCYEITEIEEENFKAIKWEDGFLITSGDGIVGATSVTEDTFQQYQKTLPTSLEETGCLSLNVTNNDQLRNPFYNKEDYTGLRVKETIDSEVSIKDLPTPTNFTFITQEWTGEVEKPEAPLPEGFPELPKTVEKPSIPSFEKRTEIYKDITIEIPDYEGPGCGWEWSGQLSPVYNEDQMTKMAEEKRTQTQEEVNQEALNYLDSHSRWITEIVKLFPKINSWNKYAIEVDKVKAQWWGLIVAREEFRPLWDNYIIQIEYRNSFIEEQEEARKSFEKSLEDCEKSQKELEKWEEKYGKENEDEEGNNEEDTKDIPEKPEGCPILPTPPEILFTPVPGIPEKPTPPEGVTIPESWRKPPEILEAPVENTEERHAEEQ